MEKINGKYYENYELVPLSKAPPDDIRWHPENLKKERLKSKEIEQLEYEYSKILIDGKPKNYNKPWKDDEIKQIIQEEDTIKTRLEFAIIFDRTPDSIEFIQAHAKREKPLYDWDKDHHLHLQIKRCQMEIGQITKEEYERILKSPGREARQERLKKLREEEYENRRV